MSNSELPPPPPGLNYQSQMMVDRDAEHLKILSICWYVVSGLAALGGFCPGIYIAMGAFAMSAAAHPEDRMVGGVFIAFGIIAMLVIWTGAVLGFITATSLKKRQRLLICYVAAAMVCLQMPVGTVLGVFTFIVLSRPSVKASFG